MNDVTPAALLRAAAEKVRKLAKAVSAPDERDQVFHADGVDIMQGRRPGMYDVATTQTPELAHYIAAMHPGVGLALAGWLDAEAQRLTLFAAPGRQEAAAPNAFAVARLILGEGVTR